MQQREMARPTGALSAWPSVRDRLFDRGGWWVSGLLAALAAVLRLPNLGRPHEFSFDETYYAKDAYSLLQFGYERAFVEKANELLMAGKTDVFKPIAEFVVHPPLGKWSIALGEAIFGMNPVGWRIVPALMGIGAVVIVHRTMLRLGATPYAAALAGLFMAIDGMAIVMSRTALLDQPLMFFIACTFHALVRDRNHYDHTLAMAAYRDDVPESRWWRPWRLLAIVWIAAAFATKWSALWFALGFAALSLAWDVSSRRRHGYTRPQLWLSDLGWVVGAAALSLFLYLLTWIGWFRSSDAWDRTWTEGPQWLPQSLRGLLYYHQQALQFHVNLTSDHPYKANPFGWLLMLRPTSFSYVTSDGTNATCEAASCSAEVLAMGNVILWWVATITIVVFVVAALAQLLRMRVEIRGHMFDFVRRTRIDWAIASGLLVGVAAGWLPWIYWHERTTFTFYVIVFTPFICMLAAYGISLFATKRVLVAAETQVREFDVEPAQQAVQEALLEPTGAASTAEFVAVMPDDAVDVTVVEAETRYLEFEAVHERRFLLSIVLVSAIVAFSIFFYPVWVGQVLSYDAWHARMWFTSWI